MSWNDHINYVVDRCKTRMNLLRAPGGGGEQKDTAHAVPHVDKVGNRLRKWSLRQCINSREKTTRRDPVDGASNMHRSNVHNPSHVIANWVRRHTTRSAKEGTTAPVCSQTSCQQEQPNKIHHTRLLAKLRNICQRKRTVCHENRQYPGNYWWKRKNSS